jgi:hypothetical protein
MTSRRTGGEDKYIGYALKAWNSIGGPIADLPRNGEKPERCDAYDGVSIL